MRFLESFGLECYCSSFSQFNQLHTHAHDFANIEITIKTDESPPTYHCVRSEQFHEFRCNFVFESGEPRCADERIACVQVQNGWSPIFGFFSIFLNHMRYTRKSTVTLIRLIVVCFARYCMFVRLLKSCMHVIVMQKN